MEARVLVVALQVRGSSPKLSQQLNQAMVNHWCFFVQTQTDPAASQLLHYPVPGL